MMNYNNENSMTETKGFIIPTALEDSCTDEEFTEDYDGLNLTFPRVKIPGGGSLMFEIPGDDPENPAYAKTIEGVILYNHAACAYWPEGAEYDDTVSPLCSSVDGKTGYGTPGGACAACELNKFGSDENPKSTGKGKACKNMRHLYILCSGEYMPILLVLPPTSLRPYTDFMTAAFVSRRRPVFASVIQIGLKRVDNGNNTYSVATFRKLHDFTGDELLQMKQLAASFRGQIKDMNRQRAADTELGSGEPICDSGETYRSTENGGHFCIVGDGIVDGDRDELPA